MHLSPPQCDAPLVEDQPPALESQIPSPSGRACQPSAPHTWDLVLCPPSKGRPAPRGPLTPAARHHDECVLSPQRINETPIVLSLILAPSLGFASLSTPTMAQPGWSHSFTPMEDLPSATPSVADCQPEYRHLHHVLLKTRQLTGLPAEQLPVPSLSEIGDVSLADSTILPLLCSLVHAMSAMGKEMEELPLQTSDLESRVPNSLPEGVDHSTQLNQIQFSLRDLSHRVAHLPPTQVSAPPPARTSRPHP